MKHVCYYAICLLCNMMYSYNMIIMQYYVIMQYAYCAIWCNRVICLLQQQQNQIIACI